MRRGPPRTLFFACTPSGMKMDLYVNGRFLHRPVTGVERYAGEVFRALGDRAQAIVPPASARGLRGHLWEQVVLPRRLPGDGLLWSPANSGPVGVKHQVVTVHDLAPLDHPEWYRPMFSWWYRWLLPRLVRQVRAVIAVSEFTRRRLLALGVPEERLFVAQPGVSPRFHPAAVEARAAARRRYGLPDRYALTVGTLEPRKNLGRLWQAWERISGSFPGIGLVCLGRRSPPFRGVDLSAAPRGVHFLGQVTDEDLPLLYSGAEIYVLASLYEGFGLTALEAMACGVPCLASRVGGVPEAVGEAAILVDPLDTGAIEAGLRGLLEDRSIRASLSVRGLERARAFRWEDTAEKLWEVCQRVGA